MKKSLLFISALCLGASSGFAQLDNIPNANFDIWTNTVTPTSWGTLNGQNPGLGAITGSATQATGANIKGANTIALHTISYGGQTAPGAAISNGAIEIAARSEEHTSELQSLTNLVCRLL